MPRPRRIRRIFHHPEINFFKPVGIPLRNLEEVIIPYEEIEALRLKNLEQMDQKKAAKKMKISQPTFNRLLISARKKITDALVNGKAIKIQGGDFKMTPQAKGRGKMGGQYAAGPGGDCICPKCGHKEPKTRGIPCTSKKCLKCKSNMKRDL